MAVTKHSKGVESPDSVAMFVLKATLLLELQQLNDGESNIIIVASRSNYFTNEGLKSKN